jgi:hypothetical protein
MNGREAFGIGIFGGLFGSSYSLILIPISFALKKGERERERTSFERKEAEAAMPPFVIFR